MKKKEKISSSSRERKKYIKISFANNSKSMQSKQKQRLNKSMDKKKNIGIYLSTEPNKNVIEAKIQNNRIHLTKQRKDKTNIYNSSYIKNRSIKTNKVREYENTLNKLNEDSINEREREKDFDFLYFKFNKEREKQRSKTYKPENDLRYKTNYIKSSKLDNSKNSQKEDNFKESLYEKKENNGDDDSSDDDLRNEDDILYRTLYRPSLTKKSLAFGNDKEKEKEKEKEKKNKELSDSKDKTILQPNSQYIINSSNLNYSTNNKKFNTNEKSNSLYNNYKNSSKIHYRNESDDSKEYRKKNDSYNDSKIYYSKSFGYLSNERTVDLYVIDTDGEEPTVSSRNRRKINRKRNIIKEIKIEKFDKYHPMRNEKLTGFVLIRKSRGKRVYDIELEDNIDKINEILKNKEIMIKNEVIQFITLKQLNNYEKEIKKYNDKILRLQNDIKRKDSSIEEIEDKDKELEKEKDDQISTLNSKIEELNKIISNQQEELDQNIREFKQVKLAYDLLQDSIEKEKKEKEPTPEQVYKLKKKAQMQKDEENNQKAIKEMKIRIKKYKDELRRASINEGSRRVSVVSIKHDDSNLKANKSPKKKQMISKDIKELKENPANPQPDSSDDENIELYNLGEDDGKDPKKRKMKNAVNRFKKKYHDVIKEEKKIKKQKEKEEREREENEEKELEDDNYENNEEKEREERERKEKEEKEREERERKEKEERERIEREEREKEEREREERERKEKEEKERIEKEEKERIEREERERKEKEEIERKEREEKERKEKERKIKEEETKKENEKKEKGNRPGQNKMMGGNFAKMLANKIKMAPPGGKKVGGAGKRVSISKPPVIEKNVNMVELLENQPFKGRKVRRKPTKKFFVEEEE